VELTRSDWLGWKVRTWDPSRLRARLDGAMSIVALDVISWLGDEVGLDESARYLDEFAGQASSPAS
jgi:hypothetical protein